MILSVLINGVRYREVSTIKHVHYREVLMYLTCSNLEIGADTSLTSFLGAD